MRLTELVVVLVIVIVLGLLAGWTIGYGLADGYPGCNTKACERRVQARGHHHTLWRWKRATRPYRAWLAQVRQCESGGNYRTATGNGYFGAYQFALRSWQAVGGRGYPHLASRAEQDFRAIRLLHIQGRKAWPVCG